MNQTPLNIGWGVTGRTLNDTIYSSFQLLESHGTERPSRNGPMKCLYDTTLVLKDPRSRHLSLRGRTSNIYQMIAETFWVMAGANAIDPYLSFFLPRAKNYSDDGETWHGAYGPRMYAMNQVEDAVNAFVQEGIDSRRSFITISDPSLDNDRAIQELYGAGHAAKDKPCNREMHFFITPGADASTSRLNMKVIQRSGDSIFGAGSINPFEFSFFQEAFLGFLQHALGMNPQLKLELGEYRWNVTNYHVYDFTKSQMEAVLADKMNAIDFYSADSSKTIPLVAPRTPEEFRKFMGELVSTFSYLIDTLTNGGQVDVYHEASMLRDMFIGASLPVTNNQLYHYARHVLWYIVSRFNQVEGKPLYLSKEESEATDFLNAIGTSGFRKYETRFDALGDGSR